MKPRRRPHKPAALALLLLGLSLGGWGLLSAVFPELAPARLAAALGQGRAGGKGDETDRINAKNGTGGDAAMARNGKSGKDGGSAEDRYYDPKALPKD